MENIERAIKAALEKRGLDFSLKDEQFKCISAIVNGEDVLAVLPTGYGKSLIFQLLPDVYDMLLGVNNSIVIVISPLNALMQDQVAKLNDQGISACMIQGHSVVHYGDGSDIQLPLDRLENPTYKLFYMHPEMCVYDKKIQAFFNSSDPSTKNGCDVWSLMKHTWYYNGMCIKSAIFFNTLNNTFSHFILSSLPTRAGSPQQCMPIYCGPLYIGSFQKRSTLPPQRKFLLSRGGGETELFLIIPEPTARSAVRGY